MRSSSGQKSTRKDGKCCEKTPAKKPRRCFFHVLLYLVMATCIIGLTAMNEPMTTEEAQMLHRLMKQRDITDNKVHFVVNYDSIKQRY